MLDILNFFGESGWRFAGLIVFMIVLFIGLISIVEAWRKH